MFISERIPEHNEGTIKTAASLAGLNNNSKTDRQKRNILSVYFRNIRFAKFLICVKKKILQYFPSSFRSPCVIFSHVIWKFNVYTRRLEKIGYFYNLFLEKPDVLKFSHIPSTCVMAIWYYVWSTEDIRYSINILLTMRNPPKSIEHTVYSFCICLGNIVLHWIMLKICHFVSVCCEWMDYEHSWMTLRYRNKQDEISDIILIRWL